MQKRAGRLGVTLAPSDAAPCPECLHVHSGRRHHRGTWRDRVRAAAQNLATEAWERRDDPEFLAAADEIRRLVLEQVADDTPSTKLDRIGRTAVGNHGWVTHYNADIDDGRPLWEAIPTPDQLALEVALQSVLDAALTGEQRVMVRMVYGAQRVTHRETADSLSITHQAVTQRLQKIHKVVREALIEAFGEPPAETRERQTGPWRWDAEVPTVLVERPAYLDKPHRVTPRQSVPHLTFAGAA